MTLSIGPNPAGQLAIGAQDDISEARHFASGDLPARLTLASSTDGVLRATASGAITTKAPQLTLIAVHPRKAVGGGDIQTPAPAFAADGSNSQNPSGNGDMPARAVFAGTAIRRVPPGNEIHTDAALDVRPRLELVGEGVISHRHITGSGDLTASLVLKDVTAVNTIRVVEIEGVFSETADIEGVFLDLFDIEGAG